MIAKEWAGRVLGCAVLAVAVAVVPADLSSATSAPTTQVRPLPLDQPADYQLGGAYPPPPGVGIVSRDWRDEPAGAYAICYVNGFQTQPEQRRWWRSKHAGLLLRHHGRLVEDRNWPGEYLLDVGTPGKRRALARLADRWLRTCATKGFDAVEPDNLDSWTRSRGGLRRSDALAYSRLLVKKGHARGLAVAQKNSAELLRRRHDVGWDFAVVEECQAYRECSRFRRAYDDAMIEIEYSDAGGRANFTAACRSHGQYVSIVYRDRDLLPAGAPGYRYDSC